MLERCDGATANDKNQMTSDTCRESHFGAIAPAPLIALCLLHFFIVSVFQVKFSLLPI
jgi:hypothetical protein